MLHNTKLFTGQSNPPKSLKTKTKATIFHVLEKLMVQRQSIPDKKFLQGSVSFARRQKDVERNRIGVLVRWQTVSCYCVTQ